MNETLEQLTTLFKNHKHLGADKSQKLLSSSVSYAGGIYTNGVAVILPTGWTSSKSAGNVYTIIHNLNSTSYGVVAIAINSNGQTYFHPYFVFNTNNFTVEFDDTSATAGATEWNFILTLIT